MVEKLLGDKALRRIGGLLLLALLVAAMPAAAVEKDLDGFARIRFGMSAEDVRATRPEGEYKPELGEYWIIKTVTGEFLSQQIPGFRIRIYFSDAGRVNRIVSENLLAQDAEDYAECRGHFEAMLGMMTKSLGNPDKLSLEDEPEYKFGQLYRARNLASYQFTNGASANLRSTWSQRPILTKYYSEYSCELSADYYSP